MKTNTPARRVKGRRSVLNLILAALAAFIVAGFLWTRLHAKSDPNGRLLTASVTQGNLIETVSATGSVTSQTGTQVKIGSQVTGRIKRLYADVGSQVKAGQVIAELDLPDVQAQLGQAQDNLAAAQTKAVQTQSGVTMERTQTSEAIAQARDTLASDRAKLASALSAFAQQKAQTPSDINRAQTAVAAAKAALSTAKSNLAQIQAGANLQVATAQEQIKQAQANAQNSAKNLQRQDTLLAKGFVAASDVDTVQTQTTINQSQVDAARQNIDLVQQKVTADLQSGRDAVTQAQANVASAQAALSAAQAEVNLTAVKAADVADARAQVQETQAALKTAQGNIAQDTLKQQDVQQAREAAGAAQEQVAYNRAQVDKTFIRSPISGTVLQLAAQQGETLAAGLSAPTLIVVADLNRLQVDAYVDETDIGKVKLGQSVQITVDAFPKKIFTGKVAKIASGSTIQQGVVTYDVTIALADKAQQLKPDMTASVTIQTGSRNNVLLVPAEAVKMGGRDATVNVLVKKDGGSETQLRHIKTGGSDGVNTEVRDGLKQGDIVVLAGMDQPASRPAGGASPFGPTAGRGGGRSR